MTTLAIIFLALVAITTAMGLGEPPLSPEEIAWIKKRPSRFVRTLALLVAVALAIVQLAG